MIKAIYKCHYDGNQCEYATPKFDECGCLIPESNEKLKTEYSKILAEPLINESWDRCIKCQRNYSISGCCHGQLTIVECEI